MPPPLMPLPSRGEVHGTWGFDDAAPSLSVLPLLFFLILFFLVFVLSFFLSSFLPRVAAIFLAVLPTLVPLLLLLFFFLLPLPFISAARRLFFFFLLFLLLCTVTSILISRVCLVVTVYAHGREQIERHPPHRLLFLFLVVLLITLAVLLVERAGHVSLILVVLFLFLFVPMVDISRPTCQSQGSVGCVIQLARG